MTALTVTAGAITARDPGYSHDLASNITAANEKRPMAIPAGR